MCLQDLSGIRWASSAPFIQVCNIPKYITKMGELQHNALTRHSSVWYPSAVFSFNFICLYLTSFVVCFEESYLNCPFFSGISQIFLNIFLIFLLLFSSMWHFWLKCILLSFLAWCWNEFNHHAFFYGLWPSSFFFSLSLSKQW